MSQLALFALSPKDQFLTARAHGEDSVGKIVALWFRARAGAREHEQKDNRFRNRLWLGSQEAAKRVPTERWANLRSDSALDIS